MSRQIIQRLIDFFSSKTLFYVFRSHQFAFSIDGGVHSLILSGSSETDSQLWMRHIRDLLWPRSNPSQATNLWPKQGKIITYQKKISIDLFLQWKWKDFRFSIHCMKKTNAKLLKANFNNIGWSLQIKAFFYKDNSNHQNETLIIFLRKKVIVNPNSSNRNEWLSKRFFEGQWTPMYNG